MFIITNQDPKNGTTEYECKTLSSAVNHFLSMVYRPVSKNYTITFSRRAE